MSHAIVLAALSLATLFTAKTWDNERPQQADLRGHVVVVDVFTVDCINCQNVVPELQRLERTYGNAVRIVGVHAPETAAEHDPAYRRAALRKQGIMWPVAVDDEFKLWNAYDIQAWPTQLIFDRHGALRKTIVGDSQDSLVESTVQALTSEK